MRTPLAQGHVRDAGVLVIGVGRFGSAIAGALEHLGRDVLAVDRNPRVVAAWAQQFPIVEADATDPIALEQIGGAEFSVAVVSIAHSLEASVLVTSNLVDIGVPQIWAKAVSNKHGRILERLGANHVVYPEAETGERVAHLLSGQMLDYVEVEDGFTVVKMRPPMEMQGLSLAQSNIRQRYGVTIIGVKTPGVPFAYATQDTIVNGNDVIICMGESENLERFATRP
jgi:trk system potassium uptake protein